MVRRVVAEVGPDGRSRTSVDGEGFSVPVGDLVFHELWRTGPDLPEDGDPVPASLEIMPPRGGTTLRVVDFPPTERDAVVELHETDSVDYNIVISGEIVAVSDTGETPLKPGDVLVQCGGRHGWRNDGVQSCVFVSVMTSTAGSDE